MWTATRELKPRAQWQAVDGRAWCHMSVDCTARLTPKDSGSISVLFTWPFAIRGPCWERVRILFWDLGLVPKTMKEELEIFDLTPLARGISSPRIVSCQWLLSSFYSSLYGSMLTRIWTYSQFFSPGASSCWRESADIQRPGGNLENWTLRSLCCPPTSLAEVIDSFPPKDFLPSRRVILPQRTQNKNSKHSIGM